MLGLDLEDICSSRGRLKVLKVVLDEGEINITRLVKETGLHYNIVRRHVARLAELGLVRTVKLERMHIVIANLDDPRVVALRDLLRLIEEL